MSELIYTLVNVPYLTTGRRLYALKRCLEQAQTGEAAALVSLIDEAISHDTETVAMERAWARSKNVSQARGESVTIDNQIDGVLGAMHSALTGNISVLPGDDPAVKASQKIIEQLFPNGVRPIITLPFEEQLVVNDTIIARLKGDLEEAVAEAGIRRFAARLESLNDAFRAELEKSQRKEIDYSVIEAAKDKGNLFVRRVVAVILGTHHQDTEEAAEKRRTLLQPILEQGERIRQARKGRRAPQDIDPETGEEVPAA